MLKKTKAIFLASILVLIILLGFNLFIPKKIDQFKIISTNGESNLIYENQYKYTLVNFWASDCPGCIKEMPALIERYKTYHLNGLQIIAVSMSYDPPNQVIEFIKKNKVPFPVTLDVDQSISKKFGGIRLTPTTIIINNKGQIIDQIIGEINFRKLDDLLKKDL